MAFILVIDDETPLQDFVRTVLENLGHEVCTAANGSEGLKAHRHRAADLILCDIFMPERGGLTTIRELQAESPSVKVIAMSGGAPGVWGMDFLPLAEQFGAAAVLYKPFSPRVLTRAVGDLLRA